MMMAGGAVEQNGVFSIPHHHSQQPHMDTDLPDSRKRPLETPAEEASCTKRTNVGGKRNQNQPACPSVSYQHCLMRLSQTVPHVTGPC